MNLNDYQSRFSPFSPIFCLLDIRNGSMVKGFRRLHSQQEIIDAPEGGWP